MSKEVTLEDLANSTKPANAEGKAKKSVAAPNLQSARAISVNDLGSHMKKVNNIDDSIEQNVPMVDSAFKSMYSTLDKRKKEMDEKIVPIIMENARDMAMQKDMGVDVENTKLGDREDAVESVPGQINDVTVEGPTDSEFDVDFKDDEDEAFVTTPSGVVISSKEAKEAIKTSTDVSTVESETKQYKTTNAAIEENSDDDDLDSLLKDLDIDDDKLDTEKGDEETNEQLRARFKETLQSVSIARDPIDLGKFKIRKTATSSAAVLNSINAQTQQLKRADWALFHSKRSICFIESRGPELEALRKTINNSNGINGVIASLRFIYDHIVDANKPKFEAWCKLIRTEDIESLYFGIYRACYADANLVARSCIGKDGCKKTSLIDTDILDMVKFEDDETKKQFYSILNKDTTTESNDVESDLLQISDNFVISYNMPTLYSTFIQYSTLKPEITDKYSDILNTMAYIDGFYSIDRTTMELVPLSIKEYPNNLNKTVLSKLKVYTEILKTLTNDQYNVLTAKLNNIIQNSKITYVYPETTCPECGVTIAQENIDSVLNLLFTRAQLVQIKSL